MRMIDTAKVRLSSFWEARGREPSRIAESDGPFQYEYCAINYVVGGKLPEDSPDPIEINSFPHLNATAYLTRNWDQEYAHIDRGNAIAALSLTKSFGTKPFNRRSQYLNRLLVWLCGSERVFLKNLNAQVAATRELRRKDHSAHGCCLVYRARVDVSQTLRLSASRRFGDIGLALDAMDISEIRETHQGNLRNVATAVSIAIAGTGGSPEVRFLTDSVHLIGAGGSLAIYVRTLRLGDLGLVVTTNLSETELARTVAIYSEALTANRKLSAAASIFAQSQEKPNDNLRSFVASWSALELLVNNLEKQCRDQWQRVLRSEGATLPEWDKSLREVEADDYRLRDRFYAVACTLNLREAGQDAERFTELNTARNSYFHRFEIQEDRLPAEAVQELFRKYLRIAISSD